MKSYPWCTFALQQNRVLLLIRPPLGWVALWHDRAFAAWPLSCAVLPVADFRPGNAGLGRNCSFRSTLLCRSDWAVLGVFTLEMAMKLVAFGPGWRAPQRDEDEMEVKDMFEDDDDFGGYFVGNWNRFDFLIVVLSWILVPIQLSGSANSEVSRLVRILRTARPLRALRSFEGTQDVLITFPKAVPAMRDGLTLLLFVFFMYGILGVNLFGVDGNWHGRCVVDRNTTFPNATNPDPTRGFLMVDLGPEVICGNSYKCAEGFRCSCSAPINDEGSVVPPPYDFQDPVTGDPGCQHQLASRPWLDGVLTMTPQCPDYGWTCFNNFGVALYTCFKTITLDSWSQNMWWAQDSLDETVGWVFFLSLIVIVSWNIVNLYVAVISGAYRRVRELRAEISKQKKAYRKQRDLKGMEDFGITKPKLSLVVRGWFASLQPKERKSALNGIAWACRSFTSYPTRIDESGQPVPADILLAAQGRNLGITFGPAYGQWTLHARGGEAMRLRGGYDDDMQKIDEGQPCAEGHSSGLRKEELRSKVNEFERSDLMNNVLSGGDNPGLSPPYFDVFVLLCIFANTACGAMDHFDGRAVPLAPGFVPGDNCCDYNCEIRSAERCARGIVYISTEWFEWLRWAECAFSVIFTLELVLKVMGLWSFRAFLFENFPTNFIDFIIVIVSDVFLVLDFLAMPVVFNVAILRLVRIMRAFRLVSRFRRLRLLFNKAYNSFKSILYVLFVLVFWHVIGSLLGMQIFRCEPRIENLCQMSNGTCPETCSDLVGDPAVCVFNDEQVWNYCPWDPNSNFNTFYDGIVTLVFVTTGEGWISIMINGIRSTPTFWPGLLFFIFFYVVAFYMLYNLFIGVIVQEFELNEDQKEGMQLGYFRVKVLKEIKRKRMRKYIGALQDSSMSATGADNSYMRAADTSGNVEDSGEQGFGDENDDDDANIGAAAEEGVTVFWVLPPPTPNAQFPDAPKNLRAYIRDLLQNRWFDRLILLAVFVSAIILAMESPVKKYTQVTPDFTRKADIIFFSIFLFEFVLKLVDNGVYWESKSAYFRTSWNLLDFLILLFQALDVSGQSGLGTLRIMRVLRPLRLLNKIQSLQLLLLAIRSCALDMMNVFLLWMFAFILFGVLGMSIFSGKLYACNDEGFVGPPMNPLEAAGSAIGWRENCVGNFWTSTNDNGEPYVADWSPVHILRPRVWANPTDGPSGLGFNFDNFAISLQSLFEVSTFEQWSDTVYASAAVTSIGQQPVPKASYLNVLFFHAWIVLSCFFVLQLVIGVLVDSINQKSGKALYTSLQRNWVQMEMRLRKLKPLAPLATPESPLRNKVWFLVNYPAFQNAITIVIVINITMLATESYAMADWWRQVTEQTNWVFIVIYMIEIILKLIAYSYYFFYDAWNLFDFIVVVASIVESTVGRGAGLQTLRVLRMLKVLRTIRLVRRARRLRLIVSALLRSIPHIISSLLLLMLAVFLFSVMGVQLFSGSKFGYGLHRRNNFTTAWNGCLLLVRVITGENWQTTMHDTGISWPYCTTDEEARIVLGDPDAIGDCGHLALSYLYFDLFYYIGNNILLNLFIAVLLENFFTLQSNFVLAQPHLESYQKIWRDLDPLGRGHISIWKFRELIQKLHADNNPLGSCVLANEIKYRSVRIELMQNKDEGDELAFSDVVATLSLHVVGAHGLPYAEMIKRQEKLAYYAQLAAVSRMTALYRGVKMQRNQVARHLEADAEVRALAAAGAETDPLAAASELDAGASQGLRRRKGAGGLGGVDSAEASSEDEKSTILRIIQARAPNPIPCLHCAHRRLRPSSSRAAAQEHARGATRDDHTREAQPFAAASVPEICLAALTEQDFNRAVADLRAMLSAVNYDRNYSGAYTALQQLLHERERRAAAWPAERPRNR